MKELQEQTHGNTCRGLNMDGSGEVNVPAALPPTETVCLSDRKLTVTGNRVPLASHYAN